MFNLLIVSEKCILDLMQTGKCQPSGCDIISTVLKQDQIFMCMMSSKHPTVPLSVSVFSRNHHKDFTDIVITNIQPLMALLDMFSGKSETEFLLYSLSAPNDNPCKRNTVYYVTMGQSTNSKFKPI